MYHHIRAPQANFWKSVLATSVVILLFCASFFSQTASAQNREYIERSILMCVRPNAGGEYALIFRETTAFGVLVPSNALVSFSSNVPISAALYEASPDANTGGYRFIHRLAQSTAQIVVPYSVGCQNAIAELADIARTPNTIVSTIQFPVSINHAVVAQIGQDEKLPDEVVGVAAFQFRLSPGSPDVPPSTLDFEILQVSKSDVELQVRLYNVPSGVPFSIVANKAFNISQSLPEIVNPVRPNDFTGIAPAAGFQFNIRRFAKETEFYKFLDTSGIRIFPAFGIISIQQENQYLGGFLGLQLEADPAQRLPPFEKGQKIRALPGAGAQYFPIRVPDKAQGRLQANNTLIVERVDSQDGRLYISINGQEFFIESWLVEVAE